MELINNYRGHIKGLNLGPERFYLQQDILGMQRGSRNPRFVLIHNPESLLQGVLTKF